MQLEKDFEAQLRLHNAQNNYITLLNNPLLQDDKVRRDIKAEQKKQEKIYPAHEIDSQLAVNDYIHNKLISAECIKLQQDINLQITKNNTLLTATTAFHDRSRDLNFHLDTAEHIPLRESHKLFELVLVTEQFKNIKSIKDLATQKHELQSLLKELQEAEIGLTQHQETSRNIYAIHQQLSTLDLAHSTTNFRQYLFSPLNNTHFTLVELFDLAKRYYPVNQHSNSLLYDQLLALLPEFMLSKERKTALYALLDNNIQVTPNIKAIKDALAAYERLLTLKPTLPIEPKFILTQEYSSFISLINNNIIDNDTLIAVLKQSRKVDIANVLMILYTLQITLSPEIIKFILNNHASLQLIQTINQLAVPVISNEAALLLKKHWIEYILSHKKNIAITAALNNFLNLEKAAQQPTISNHTLSFADHPLTKKIHGLFPHKSIPLPHTIATLSELIWPLLYIQNNKHFLELFAKQHTAQTLEQQILFFQLLKFILLPLDPIEQYSNLSPALGTMADNNQALKKLTIAAMLQYMSHTRDLAIANLQFTTTHNKSVNLPSALFLIQTIAKFVINYAPKFKDAATNHMLKKSMQSFYEKSIPLILQEDSPIALKHALNQLARKTFAHRHVLRYVLDFIQLISLTFLIIMPIRTSMGKSCLFSSKPTDRELQVNKLLATVIEEKRPCIGK